MKNIRHEKRSTVEQKVVKTIEEVYTIVKEQLVDWETQVSIIPCEEGFVVSFPSTEVVKVVDFTPPPDTYA